jgi:hypothetical protein
MSTVVAPLHQRSSSTAAGVVNVGPVTKFALHL